MLFGDYNPGGKLPVTFYRSNDDLPDFLDYSMKNRTYRYFTGKPQYAFGYGLSYTTFNVGKGKMTAKSAKAGKTNKAYTVITVPVTNTGKREGTETFQKLTLKPGETKQAVIALDSEAFEYYDEMIDELAVKPGRYQILYGTSSEDKDLKALDFVVK